jgi:hypothetical protein
LFRSVSTSAEGFSSPAFVYFMDGDRVEIVKLLTPSSHRGNQVGVFKPREVLCHRLAGHIKVRTKLSQRPASVLVQGIQQASPGRVSESLEHLINTHGNQFMQQDACMSRTPVRYPIRAGRSGGI